MKLNCSIGYCKKEYLPNHRGFDSFFGQWSHVVNYYTRITPVKQWNKKKKYLKKQKSIQNHHKVDYQKENEMKIGYDLHYDDNITHEYEGKEI